MDFVIKKGQLINPAMEVDSILDVEIADGVITTVAPNLDVPPRASVINADARLVLPGLVDFHPHVNFDGSPWRIDSDKLGPRACSTMLG